MDGYWLEKIPSITPILICTNIYIVAFVGDNVNKSNNIAILHKKLRNRDIQGDAITLYTGFAAGFARRTCSLAATHETK
jgi:hypothetical protein